MLKTLFLLFNILVKTDIIFMNRKFKEQPVFEMDMSCYITL